MVTENGFYGFKTELTVNENGWYGFKTKNIILGFNNYEIDNNMVLLYIEGYLSCTLHGDEYNKFIEELEKLKHTCRE